MRRLAELVRDLFEIECSPTQARRLLLLRSAPPGGNLIGMTNWPAALIPVSGASRQIAPQADTFSLIELQTYVGGYIEAVYLPGNRVMFVNEEGLLKELPLNVSASSLAQRWIVGDVVVCDRKLVNEEG